MFSEITRRTLIGTAAGAVLSFSAAVAQAQQPTFALVQINQQALFFNQMNEGAQEGRRRGRRQAGDLQRQQRSGGAEQRHRDLHPAEGATASSSSRSTSTASCRPSSRPPRPASRWSPSTRSCPPVRRRRRSASTTPGAGALIGEHFVEVRRRPTGRQGQARHRRRAELLHPEHPPERLRGHSSRRQRHRDGRRRRRAATSRTTRLAAAENLMTGNPDLTAIYATGEPALLGAVAAVESQGRRTASRSSAGT